MESASTRPRDRTMPLAVAVAGSADIDALVTLVNSAYRGESSRRGWTTEEHLLGGQRTDAGRIGEMITAPGQRILVVRDDEGLCACVLLEEKPGRVCYLGMLTVRPGLQSRGIGARLLAASEAWARAHMGSDFVEMTVIELRRELIDWYERRGYRTTGEIRPFPYDDQRFGLPKRADLQFVVLRRRIAP